MLTASALLGTRIGAGVCLFIVANLIYALFKTRNQVAAGKNWARTTGKIIASSASQPATPRKGDETNTTVNIRYQYRVGGEDYEGDRIKFGGQSGVSAVAADAILAKYPLGTSVDVYYNPKSPSHAALEPRDKGNVTALVAFLVVFTVISAVLVAHSIAGRVLYTENGVPLFAFMLPLFAIMIAVAALVQYVLQSRQAAASTKWPTVQGRITRADIIEEVREEKDDSSSGSVVRTVTRYRPDVQFAYTVGGREFHSNIWKWGWTAIYSDEDSAKASIAKYAAGSSQPVFYNPVQPAEAVLEPGSRSGIGVQLVFSAMFGLGGLLMLWAFSVVRM